MRRDFQAVDSHDMTEPAVQVAQRCGYRSLPVEHNGELVGMLTLESVGEFMMIHSAMRRAEQSRQVPQATPSLT
jgi:predicted transcriptional regulator